MRPPAVDPPAGPPRKISPIWIFGGLGAVALIAVVLVVVLMQGGADGEPAPKAGDPTGFALTGEYNGTASGVTASCVIQEQELESYKGNTVTLELFIVTMTGAVKLREDRDGPEKDREFELQLSFLVEDGAPVFAPARGAYFAAALSQDEPEPFDWGTLDYVNAEGKMDVGNEDLAKEAKVSLGDEGRLGAFELSDDVFVPLGGPLSGHGFVGARGSWQCGEL